MKLKELFDKPERWGQRHLASDAEGFAVPLVAHMTTDEHGQPTPTQDCRYCLLGGLMACYTAPERRRVENKIDAWLETRGFLASYVSWNDDANTTFEDVRAMVEELDI